MPTGTTGHENTREQQTWRDKPKIERIAPPFPSVHGLAEKVEVENSLANSVPLPSDELTFGPRKNVWSGQQCNKKKLQSQNHIVPLQKVTDIQRRKRSNLNLS
uniref:Uncharacterized protein n=1 Tax=Glossina austeni TaxID=7395 RepID=A0A1A9UWK6_GLOAU